SGGPTEEFNLIAVKEMDKVLLPWIAFLFCSMIASSTWYGKPDYLWQLRLVLTHQVNCDSDLDLLRKLEEDLMSLKLFMCEGFSINGLMCVAKHCSELRELCVDEIDTVVCDEVAEEREKWLRVLALRKTGGLRSSRICMMCPNLEVLHANDECGDTGLQLISQFCRKLRKLTVHSGTHMGLMAVAQGCPNLEYLKVWLTDISNESLECIGSNLKNLHVFNMHAFRKKDNPDSLLDNGI
ncbi:leucine-rich repeat, cysteine-containing subtype protein, partial [Tanacetum coccineum]